jgi:DNA-directed RNA polymerase subunit RPC12/RpoP
MNFEIDEEGIARCPECGYAGEFEEFVEDSDDFIDTGNMECPDCGAEFVLTTEDEGEEIDEGGKESTSQEV